MAAANDDAFEEVRKERDPVRRGRLATELLSVYQERTTELARIRKAAVNELHDQGMSYSEVATAFGLSKGRIGQIRQTGPRIERGFFGLGPITIAFPQRAVEGRSKPVIASEDAHAVEMLHALLTDLGFEVERHPIPPSGRWKPTGGTVAICGPKSSPVVDRLLRQDPVLAFAPDEAGNWVITDKETKAVHRSPADHRGQNGATVEDVAYIGRLSSRNGSVLVIAGVHATGSIGAVHYLTGHLEELHRAVGTKPFSMAVTSTVTDHAVEKSEALCPPRTHPTQSS